MEKTAVDMSNGVSVTIPGTPADVSAKLATMGYGGLLGKIASGFESANRIVINKRDTIWQHDRRKPKRIILTRLAR